MTPIPSTPSSNTHQHRVQLARSGCYSLNDYRTRMHLVPHLLIKEHFVQKKMDMNQAIHTLGDHMCRHAKYSSYIRHGKVPKELENMFSKLVNKKESDIMAEMHARLRNYEQEIDKHWYTIEQLEHSSCDKWYWDYVTRGEALNVIIPDYNSLKVLPRCPASAAAYYESQHVKFQNFSQKALTRLTDRVQKAERKYADFLTSKTQMEVDQETPVQNQIDKLNKAVKALEHKQKVSTTTPKGKSKTKGKPKENKTKPKLTSTPKGRKINEQSSAQRKSKNGKSSR